MKSYLKYAMNDDERKVMNTEAYAEDYKLAAAVMSEILPIVQKHDARPVYQALLSLVIGDAYENGWSEQELLSVVSDGIRSVYSAPLSFLLEGKTQ